MDNLINFDNFQERLRRARKKKGLSQQELADLLGIVVGTVGNWEIGPSKPQPENLRKLADVLGVSSEKLLYGEHGTLKEAHPLYQGEAESDDLMRIKCREHFEKFLASCLEAHQVGWFYIELTGKFPINKFSSRAQPPSPAQEKPVSSSQGDTEVLSAADFVYRHGEKLPPQSPQE